MWNCTLPYSHKRWLNTGQTPFCLLNNLAREPIRRSGCPWEEKALTEGTGGWHFENLLRAKAEVLIEQRASIKHCFVHKFDNIRTRPLLIWTQGIRFCLKKALFIPPGLASAESFIIELHADTFEEGSTETTETTECDSFVTITTTTTSNCVFGCCFTSKWSHSGALMV